MKIPKGRKREYYMESIGWEEFYTTDKELYNKKCLQKKWQGIYDNLHLWFILFLFIAGISLAPQESLAWKCTIAWCFTGVGVLGIIVVLILVFVSDKKIAKYKWKKEFESSKEFYKQCDKYKKLEKQRQDKIKTEKATKLVESYEILDNKELGKQEKIDLIKKYIEIEKD